MTSSTNTYHHHHPNNPQHHHNPNNPQHHHHPQHPQHHLIEHQKNSWLKHLDEQHTKQEKVSKIKSSYCKGSCCIASLGILLALGGLIAGVVGIFILVKDPSKVNQGAICAAAGGGAIVLSCFVGACVDEYKDHLEN